MPSIVKINGEFLSQFYPIKNLTNFPLFFFFCFLSKASKSTLNQTNAHISRQRRYLATHHEALSDLYRSLSPPIRSSVAIVFTLSVYTYNISPMIELILHTYYSCCISSIIQTRMPPSPSI